ncbi:MAG: S1C family serine protease, partial [Porcipelethomonas sp.]
MNDELNNMSAENDNSTYTRETDNAQSENAALHDDEYNDQPASPAAFGSDSDDNENQLQQKPGPDAYTPPQQPYCDDNNTVQVSYDYSDSKPHKSKANVFIAVMLCLIFAASAFLGVYCIITDISNADYNSLNIAQNNSDRAPVVLNAENKPVQAEDKYIDDDGKYTTEGIAKYIRPQIVEIYVYDSSDMLMPVGSGSGIIITEDGYIVTNTHVIDSADKYIVTTSDSEEYEAVLVGRDAKTDIAVIKIDAKGLPAAVLGNSDEVELGENVVAIGNPAGLTGSVSDGIISGVDRKIRVDATGYEMTCLQTDAAISAGNSGGALVNMYGQIIGITSSKYIDYIHMSYEGLGFAITINEAKPIIEELISTGYVSGRVKMGITFFSSNSYIDEYFKETFGFDMPDELEKSIMITGISDDCDISNTDL